LQSCQQLNSGGCCHEIIEGMFHHIQHLDWRMLGLKWLNVTSWVKGLQNLTWFPRSNLALTLTVCHSPSSYLQPHNKPT
jgi:hypothetical protein